MEASSKASQVGTMRKKCGKCNKSKIASSFAMSKSAKDGLFGWCKICQNDSSKERAEKMKAFADLFDINPAELLSFQDAKKFFKIGETELRQWIDNGDVMAINVGTGKSNHWRVIPRMFNQLADPAPEDLEDLDRADSPTEASHRLTTAPSGPLDDVSGRRAPTGRTFRALYVLQGYAMAMEDSDKIVGIVEELTAAIEEWA